MDCSILGIFVLFAVIITVVRSDYTRSSDGDVVECVDKYKQPAFNNTLLTYHKLQEMPSEIPTEMQKKIVWNTSEASVATANCPNGTVPIRRNGAILHNRTYPNTGTSTPQHEYAEASTQIPQKLYGTKAILNVWGPKIDDTKNELSISQIWIVSGEYDKNNLNTIEVGWQVCPGLYNDTKPRLFVFWTSDAYVTTGGYNLDNPGFIQTSNKIVLGGAITPISSLGGSQYEVTITVWKDRKSGNWWLSLGPDNSLVGYWPTEIFTTLVDHATSVHWGGEIVDSHRFDRHTRTQMGSGLYPEEGFGKASYIRNLKIVRDNNNFESVQKLDTVAEGTHYKIKSLHTDDGDTQLFFGGPESHTHRIVPLRLSWFFIYFCFSFFIII